MLNFGDADTTQKATGATSAQTDFICVICTSNRSSSTAAVASLSLPLSLCVALLKGTSHNNIAIISLPALLFFRSYNGVFVQTAFIPYYLSTDIDFVCVLCTSSSTADVVSLSLPLSLSVFVQGYLTQQYRHFSTYPFYFFAATTKCLYKRHLFPTSLLARIIFRFVTTGLTGGCSEGLGAFRFFFK